MNTPTHALDPENYSIGVSFRDGPAAGQKLSIRSSPLLLRVVRSSRGNWDALDQPGDEANPQEEIFVYVLVTVPSAYFVRASKGMGGRWVTAAYVHWPTLSRTTEPADALLRDNEAWRAWAKTVGDYVEQLLPQKLRDAIRNARQKKES